MDSGQVLTVVLTASSRDSKSFVNGMLRQSLNPTDDHQMEPSYDARTLE